LLKFFARKIVQGLLMVIVVSAIAFSLLSSVGGDAFSSLRDNPQVSAETVERLRATYGLDRPLIARYLNWLSGIARGDMGESFAYKTPAAGLIFARLWNTLMLGLLGLIFALTVASILAFLSVRFPASTLHEINDAIILLSASTPRIVLSLFTLLLTVWLAGRGIRLAPGSWGLMALAAVVLSVPLVAAFLAQMQNGLAEAMNEPFVQFARAKGLPEGTVLIRHAGRAALNPLLSILGLSLGSVVAGSVIVETVLGWQGIGALMVSAVRGRDIPLVMGIVVVASAAVWFGNALAEFLQLINDKRLRETELR
jgi:peptide/nickel transport system permease protein